MKIKNRQQLLVIIAIVSAALFVADQLIIEPLIHVWQQRSVRIEGLRKLVTQGNKTIGEEKIIRGQWNRMKSNNLSATENDTLKKFDAWARSSKLNITSIKPQWKEIREGRTNYTMLEYSVEAQGGLSSIAEFIQNIEKDALEVGIESAGIRARDNDGQQLSVELRISGSLLKHGEQNASTRKPE